MKVKRYISNYSAIFFTAFILSINAYGHDFFVSPSGNDENSGTLSAPILHLQVAADKAIPGDVIYVRGGIYMYSSRITIGASSGNAESQIKIVAYENEKPIFDFSQSTSGSSSQGILINSHYWHLKGLEVCNATYDGIRILDGNHNLIENCVSHHNNGSGFSLGLRHGEMGNEAGERCAYNTLLNCDSYLNFDYSSGNGSTPGTNADGFACKLRPGKGNKFIGCRSWRNSDDGWDLFESGFAVWIENCWAWSNGEWTDFKDIYLQKTGKQLTEAIFSGDGNGIKIGGNDVTGTTCTNQSRGTHIIHNCISFDHYKPGANGHKGFDQNSHRDGAYFENCLAFGNNENYRFWVEPNPGKAFLFRNCISFDNKVRGDKFISGSTSKTNSWDLDLNGNSSQFVSLSEEDARSDRNPDGSLPKKFGKLIPGSIFIDQGSEVDVINVEGQSVNKIPYNGDKPDLGAFEYGYVLSSSSANRYNNNIEIFPNPLPVNHELNIRFNSIKEVSLSLYNINGTKLRNLGTFKLAYAGEVLKINKLAEYSGIYILKIDTELGITIKKVLQI